MMDPIALGVEIGEAHATAELAEEHAASAQAQAEAATVATVAVAAETAAAVDDALSETERQRALIMALAELQAEDRATVAQLAEAVGLLAALIEDEADAVEELAEAAEASADPDGVTEVVESGDGDEAGTRETEGEPHAEPSRRRYGFRRGRRG